MTAPSQEYQPLSHALNPPAIRQTANQNPQPDLPRLQLAPPEHQKHLQAQAQARQQQEAQHKQPSISPTAPRSSDERATSNSSSREVSPAVGVETQQPSTGQKRKPAPPKTPNSNSKKRKTDPPQEEVREPPLQYGLGTHYPYTYAYPGAPPPPPLPAFHPPPPNPNTGPSAEMSFNEFQWRLLNLCGEFYEAATELIRSTPHHVLSQAFQLLGRGNGMDPISVLNDARRTCDILLTNPQALATAPPPPAALPLPILTSLAHLNSRASVGPAAPPSAAAPPSYYPSQAPQPPAAVVNEMSNSKGKEKERIPNNVQGTWKEYEVQRLKTLAEKHRVLDKAAVAEEEEEEEEEEAPEGAEGESSTKPPKTAKPKDTSDIDWDKVIAEFGDGRSRHQVLIKATYLGLKPSSSLPGKKPKKKRASITPAEPPPPPTFSSTSAKSIPVGYSPSQLGTAQSPSATPSVSASTPTRQPKPASASNAPASTSTDAQKLAAVPPPPLPQQHQPQHPHAHSPYAQTGWYPHPQNPYYAYHHPMYYSPHPQGYGMQGYGMQSPQGYYGQPYVPPLATTESTHMSPPAPEKQKGKRKVAGRDNGTASGNSRVTPVPPPSLPPKTAPTDPAAVKAVAPTSKSKPDTPASAASTPQVTPVSIGGAPTTTGSSGILRRGPNNSLFTYTPLPHGPGGAATAAATATVTEQAKEA